MSFHSTSRYIILVSILSKGRVVRSARLLSTTCWWPGALRPDQHPFKHWPQPHTGDRFALWMVKGLISRLDLVTCAVKHSSVPTSPHWNTRCRTRNPLHCVPLPHPTVTGPPVPYLYLQHSPASHSYSTAGRSCSHVTSVPNVLVWSQEEEAIFSAPGGMSEVRLWCRCCLVPGGAGAGLVPELRFLKWKQRREIFVPCLGRGRR